MRKLVVTHYDNKILQAVIQDGKVTDLNLSEGSTVLGNIYVGKVANIVNNIPAEVGAANRLNKRFSFQASPLFQ